MKLCPIHRAFFARWVGGHKCQPSANPRLFPIRRRAGPLSSVSMRFDIVTIFPAFFESVFAQGIVRRAQTSGLVEIRMHDLREFTHDRHRTVDDRPFGGGEGMVLKPEPLAEALASLGVGPKTGIRDQGPGIGQGENAGPSTSSAEADCAQDD